ncbi:hypothetical protein [Planomicrobium sp. Y74]|uniref:hypothetical protein n=1 Tax=Planomicrobium sp. Y74 TaxID=2478977 RepID=UPI000EF4A435|nr:hypothetical protein [Planomicrobium sp. Y74]RLQ83844.1 hypothetical protein D9754_17550 [Planomicrobium sp. Y74]
MENYCDNLLDYVNHQGTANEAIGLMEHLHVCQRCRQNIDLYRESLELMQQGFTIRDVPGSLKKEILDFVFEK